MLINAIWNFFFYNICRISFPSKEVIYQLAHDSRWELLTILTSDVFNPWQEASATCIRKMLQITIVDKWWQKKVLVMISFLLEKLSAYTTMRVLLGYWLLLLLLSLKELFSNFCLILTSSRPFLYKSEREIIVNKESVVMCSSPFMIFL